MSGFSRRGISPVVLGLILVVLVLSGAILGYVFLFGFQQGFNTNTTGVNAVVTPTLYSRDAKVGVFGDTSNVSVSLSNTLSTAQVGAINITSGGHVMKSVSFVLLPHETRTVNLPLKLNATGVWSVGVMVGGAKSNGYYFQVFATRDEADFAVGQWRDQNYYRNLTLGTAIAAIAALILSAASFARRPKTIIQT
jgi:hypothetical protein